VLVCVVLAFASLTVVRGLGWATADRDSLALVVRESLESPALWGLGLALVGVGLWAAYLSHIHVVVWLAHGLAAVTYFAIAAALALAVVKHGNGWNNVVAPTGGFIWHALLAWLTGPIPDRQHGGSAHGDTD